MKLIARAAALSLGGAATAQDMQSTTTTTTTTTTTSAASPGTSAPLGGYAPTTPLYPDGTPTAGQPVT